MKTILTLLLISSLLSGRSSSRSPENLRTRVQRIYTAELGIKEKTGKNDGPRVEEYLKAVGLHKGDPWCAAFVCWVFDKAGLANPHTGWAPGLFPQTKVIWQRKTGLQTGGKLRDLHPPPLPRRGDVFGIWFPEKGRIAHAGFVDRWEDDWVVTVEGNTNEAGSREGDGVWRKRRLAGSVYQVAGWVGN